ELKQTLYNAPSFLLLGCLLLSHQRLYNVQDYVDFAPRSVPAGRGDGLAMISIIVALFVFLAVAIIVIVQYGPRLRIVQITLQHEPMPQDMENGIHLTQWKTLDSQRKCSTNPPVKTENNSASGLHIQCAREEPNIIEITYL
uniref:Uncharacterized protein n=1 Tax=Salvator merianae TaxID=96440 RepID=A0A8D0DYR1_SALMN